MMTAALQGSRRPARLRAGFSFVAFAIASALAPASAQVTASADYLARMDADRDGRISLVEHRARLSAVLEARGNDAAATLQNLQAWCKEAEASGIRALEDFSARLKGYQLQA